ncbi:MAG: hypothetical protein LQ341_007825 [Variospora aurantia]|nr:MAG: hypothetical protein LQ341_007825 [Variospora aurantia]
MLPSWYLPFRPWRSGLEFKILASEMPRACGHLAVVRDRDTGRIYPDPVDGRCRIAHTPSLFDRRNALEAVLGMCKMLYVTGAENIWLSKSDVMPFVRERDATNAEEGINDPAFQSWLQSVRSKGMNQPETTWATAHQMGTCRMSSVEKKGVVDPQGKVWGTEGLYVADASVFPSASGVNPMVTNMAIADMISRGVAKGLRVEEGARL